MKKLHDTLQFAALTLVVAGACSIEGLADMGIPGLAIIAGLVGAIVVLTALAEKNAE